MVFYNLHQLQNHVADHMQNAVQQEEMCVYDLIIQPSSYKTSYNT